MPGAASASSHATTHASSLEVYLLGCVDYASALALQEQAVFDISGRDDSRGVLLICEHPPLITLGREASRADVRADERQLEEIDVRWVARGGGAIVHAPGQVAAYLIAPLDRLGLGVADYRARMEDAGVAVCHDMHVPAKRRPNEPGLWSRGGQVGLFGASVKSWVSYHGLYLNVDPHPSFLKLASVNSRGDFPTMLQAQRIDRASMAAVRESLVRHLVERFRYERHHIHTGHPGLRRELRKVCLHA